MARFEGSVALVTGAASGIGRACAAGLARADAWVVASDIDAAGLAETCATIRDTGGEVEAQRLDVSEEADWNRVMGSVKAAGRGLHILVNNAALCIHSPLSEMSLATWRRQNAVNLDSVFLGTRAALEPMTRSGGGSIVNISSVAGLKGIAGLCGYCASKGAFAFSPRPWPWNAPRRATGSASTPFTQAASRL